MMKKIGDVKVIRNEALAGIAVMAEDVKKAEDLLDAIQAPGQLLTFNGNRFTSFVAVDDESLDGLAEFQAELEKTKTRFCLALSVPTGELQTEPTMRSDGSVERTFCSTNGIPIRTQVEGDDKKGGRKFTRPTFWLIRLVVADGVTFYATLFGQFRSGDGRLDYRPMTRKSFDTEAKAEVEKPITRICESEEQAARELNLNTGFLYAMVKPAMSLADGQRRRQGLRASVNRAAVAPLTSALGETFPGLESLKVKLEAKEAPADKPAPAPKVKKAKKAKKTEAEPVVAE